MQVMKQKLKDISPKKGFMFFWYPKHVSVILLNNIILPFLIFEVMKFSSKQMQ